MKQVTSFVIAMGLLLLTEAVAETLPKSDEPTIPQPDLSKQNAYTVDHVVDGDTFVVAGRQTKTGIPKVTMRLIGVDVPQAADRYGKEASAFLTKLLKGKKVYLLLEGKKLTKDKEGRVLVYAYRAPDGLFVNAEVIRQGWGRVRAASSFKYDKAFRQLEAVARTSRKGLWEGVGAQPTTQTTRRPANGAQPGKRGARNDKWHTVERLLLDADTAKRAKTVYVSDNGRRVGFSEQSKDGKERMVIDGRPQKWYENVGPISLGVRIRSQLFLQHGKHYVYYADAGDGQRMVVMDGKQGKKYTFINTLAGYIDSAGGLWACSALEKGGRSGGAVKFIVNGKELHTLPLLVAFGDVLIVGRHSLCIDFAANKFYAVFDGRRGPGFRFIDKKTLMLHSTGSHAYVATQDIDSGYRIVVNGRPSKRIYKFIWEHGYTFSDDGKRHAVSAKTMDGRYVVVVDGREYPVSDFASQMTFSPDGRRWACSVSNGKKKSVIVDGKVTGAHYDDVLYLRGKLVFSPDGRRIAFGAKRDGRAFVVLDGKEQKAYHNVKSLTFSPDGKHLAYVAQETKGGKSFVVADGIRGKPFPAIAGGTINWTSDGRTLAYIAYTAKAEQAYPPGVLVIAGRERKRYSAIAPQPNRTLYFGPDLLSYVAVRDGAYYWVEEKRMGQ